MIPRGYLYVIGCASSFGIITTLAKITYDEGASPPTVVFFRLLAGSLLMGIMSAWSHRKNLRSGKSKPESSNTWRLRVLIIVTGISIAVMSLGYLGSVKYIPVSLSVLLFFTFPFWVLLLNYFIDGEVPERLKLIAFVIAFFGLALTLGPTWQVLDWRGIALVLAGALGSAGMIIGGAKSVQLISMSNLVFFSNTVGAVLVGIILLLTDSFSLSQTPLGWAGIASICVLFVLGQLSLFAATRHIGSAQTSIMLNLEPFISIGAAMLLLGERLQLSQSLGVLVVISALFMASGLTRKFSKSSKNE
jgi:drug/metabolite transporter (DMT)-like permease